MAATNINNKKSANRRWRGTSTLEAAFVLILLLIVTLGIMGWGWFFLRIQQITHATRNGARMAALYASKENEVKYYVVNSLDDWKIECAEPVLPYGVNPPAGEPVKVTVTGLELDILHLGSEGIIMIPVPDDFTCSVTMAKEGP